MRGPRVALRVRPQPTTNATPPGAWTRVHVFWSWWSRRLATQYTSLRLLLMTYDHGSNARTRALESFSTCACTSDSARGWRVRTLCQMECGSSWFRQCPRSKGRPVGPSAIRLRYGAQWMTTRRLGGGRNPGVRARSRAAQGRTEQGREQRHSLKAFNKVESASSKRPGVLLDKVWRPLWHPRWLVGSATGRALR